MKVSLYYILFVSLGGAVERKGRTDTVVGSSCAPLKESFIRNIAILSDQSKYILNALFKARLAHRKCRFVDRHWVQGAI
eukprot:2710148-Pyramimonas_sp.AAC.1